jgi:colicin import membrane protein
MNTVKRTAIAEFILRDDVTGKGERKQAGDPVELTPAQLERYAAAKVVHEDAAKDAEAAETFKARRSAEAEKKERLEAAAGARKRAEAEAADRAMAARGMTAPNAQPKVPAKNTKMRTEAGEKRARAADRRAASKAARAAKGAGAKSGAAASA